MWRCYKIINGHDKKVMLSIFPGAQPLNILPVSRPTSGFTLRNQIFIKLKLSSAIFVHLLESVRLSGSELQY